MGSYKKIGLSHEMGLIDTPPLRRKQEYATQMKHCNIINFYLNTRKIADLNLFVVASCRVKGCK